MSHCLRSRSPLRTAHAAQNTAADGRDGALAGHWHGASSAVFSVVHALLLRPLPYPEPERLVAIWLHSPGIGFFCDWPSPGQYVDIQNENQSFDQMSISRLANCLVLQIAENRITHLPGILAQGIVSALLLTGAVGWEQISVDCFTPAPGQEVQVDIHVARQIPSAHFRYR